MKLSALLFLAFIFLLANHSSAQTFDELMQQAEAVREDYPSRKKAIKLYTKAIKLNEKSAEAYYWRGCVKSQTDLSKGLDDIFKSIEIDPSYEPPYHQLSLYYSVTGDYEKGEYYQRKAIALNPGEANNQLLMARIVREEGDLKRALVLCDSSISQHHQPTEWLTTIERAEIKFDLLDYAGAVEDFKKCFNELGGMYSSRQYELCGDAYQMTGKMGLACDYWKKAVKNMDEEFPSETAAEKIRKYCQ